MRVYGKIISEKRARLLLLVITLLLPAIVNIFVSLLSGNGWDITGAAPYNSDEIFWHSQTASSVKYLIPQGYYGYNGSHAQVGTYGAWGFFPFIPYVILCRIFGMFYYSRHLINLLFLGAGLLCFALMTELDKKQILLMDLVYIFMPVTVRYSISAMNEGERYAFSIVAAGMIIRLFNRECKAVFKYIIVSFFLLYGVLSYSIFVLFIPVYIFALLKEKGVLMKTVVSLAAAVAAFVPERVVNSLCSAEYTLYASPDIMGILAKKLEGGLYEGIKEIIYMMYRNMARFGPKNLINIRDRESGIYSVYLGMTALICLLLTFWIIYSLKKKSDIKWILMAAWFFMGFVFAFGALYTDDEVTLTRGINCGLIVLLMILVSRGRRKMILAYIVFVCITGLSSLGYIKNVCNESNAAGDMMPYIESEKEKFSEIMEIDEDDRWANTVAYYGSLSTYCLEIPDGFGINYMNKYDIDHKAGWILIMKDFDESSAALYENEEGPYEKAFENKEYILMKKSGN